MKKNIKVTLNGKTVYGYEGQRILDLCTECGVEIPTLCYDPHLSLHGGCSVCLVEVEGAKTLLRACEHHRPGYDHKDRDGEGNKRPPHSP